MKSLLAYLPGTDRNACELTSAIYDILGCFGIIRVDYIVTARVKRASLEVNTTSGILLQAFIPQQCAVQPDGYKE